MHRYHPPIFPYLRGLCKSDMLPAFIPKHQQVRLAVVCQLAIKLYPHRTRRDLWSDALIDNKTPLLGNGRYLKELTININLKWQHDAIDRIPAQFFDKQGLKIKGLEILLGALAMKRHWMSTQVGFKSAGKSGSNSCSRV